MEVTEQVEEVRDQLVRPRATEVLDGMEEDSGKRETGESGKKVGKGGSGRGGKEGFKGYSQEEEKRSRGGCW